MTDDLAPLASLDPTDHDVSDLDGRHVLEDVHAYMARFVDYPSDHAHVAHTLWIAHTHLMAAWETTPRIAFLSPEPESGKTRAAIEAPELLVHNPVTSLDCTPAYIFRKVGDPDVGFVTLLYDEIDTVFGPKSGDNDDIRRLLNGGYRRHATVGRCVVRGKEVFTEDISAYSAVAMAGIGKLPDTVMSRSVVINMKRRRPGVHVESFRRRLVAPEAEPIRDRLAAWAETVTADVADSFPELPDGIVDRAGDIWEPLVAVADAAGGGWPRRARVAAVALVAESAETPASLGVRLLADLWKVFDGRDAMWTSDVLDSLNGLEEAPWGMLKGSPMDPRRLAWFLSDYQVTSKDVRIGEVIKKGYTRADLWDPWERYVFPPPPTGEALRPLQPRQDPENGRPVADVADVADVAATEAVADDQPPGETCAGCGHPATANDLDGVRRCDGCVSWNTEDGAA